MLDEMLEAALGYAAQGWLVVPLHSVADGVCTCGDAGCTSAGKHPRTRTGLSEASLDHAQIRLWWERWPASNVGIATGERSGVWVLDVDAKGSPSGVESWAALVAEHGQQETQTAETGSGGAHVVYAWADGVRNRQGIKVDGERTQIDVRGDGGYIVAPPSVHASGRRYRWVRQDRPAPAPEWLLGLVLPPVPKAGPPPVVRVDALDRETRYAQAVLRTAVDRIGSAGPGARHQTITREVYSVAGFERLLGGHGLDTLLQAVIAVYAAEPKRHRKAAETVRDTWAAGAESPREVPDRRPDRGPSGPSPSDPLPDDGDIEPTDWSLLEAVPGASDGPPPMPVEAYDDEIPDGPPRQTESETPVARIGPRMIQINLRPMMDVVGDAWAALAEAPAIDRLYQQDGRVVRIMSTETGARVEECNAGSMVAALLGSATYCKLRKARKGEATDGEFVLEPSDRLPGYLSQAMLGRPDPGLPVLEAIHSAPYVAPGPVLVRTAGYHPAARAYLDWAGDLELPDLGDAQDLLGEWVGDFPFASDSDRAHWFASLLAPMMRGVIRGPVPLTVYEAPAPGTGKSLLMMVTARVASGRTVAPAALSSNEDERRKAVLAHLGAGPPVVCLDNVTGTVNDDVLAGVITAWPRYTDRRMGGQSLMSVPAISSWCMSANNATMSPDIARRMVRVRLDSREASPELRTGFRHPNLTSWTEKEAPHLRAAALALVWAWAEAGSPAWGGKALGSFESWSRNVGGVLQHAGIVGFLDGRAESMDAVDPESRDWRELLYILAQKGPGISWRPGAVSEIARENGLLAETLGDGGRNTAARLMGRAMRAQLGRVYVVRGERVQFTDVGSSGGVRVWRVVDMDGRPVRSSIGAVS
jgi:hypothetical protein